MVEDLHAGAFSPLADSRAWPEDSIRAAMAGRVDRSVPVRDPAPVVLFYATVVVTPTDSVIFYEDVYGHDRALDRALQGSSSAGPAASDSR